MTPLAAAVLEELTPTPATLEEIADWTRLPRRTVERAVESLRLGGQPILADGRGVWLSADPGEIRDVARARRRRTAEISKVTRALLHTANRLEREQLALGLFAKANGWRRRA